MAGRYRFEKTVLALAALFLATVLGYFLLRQMGPEPYRVETQRSDTVAGAPAQGDGQDASHPPSLLEGEVLDLNEASAADLTRLPGIGEKRAQAIVAYREEHGPFQSVEDVTQVSGIGEGIFNQIRDYVSIDG